MKTITINHGNGKSTTYQVLDNGTAYHVETPENILNILERARINGTKLKLYFGDVNTGRDWNEEHDTIGTIGRSTGTVKIPLLITSSRSYGGGAILDHCIVKIKNVKTGETLYQQKEYQKPVFNIVPSDLPEYSHNVNINGSLYSRHKTERGAKLLVSKMR